MRKTWTASKGIQPDLWLLESPFFIPKRNHCTCALTQWAEKQTNIVDSVFSSGGCKKLNKWVKNIITSRGLNSFNPALSQKNSPPVIRRTFKAWGWQPHLLKFAESMRQRGMWAAPSAPQALVCNIMIVLNILGLLLLSRLNFIFYFPKTYMLQ